MAQAQPSMQELIARRKRAGFVGRRAEIDRFRANFDLPPDDERHSFVFHLHGVAGVGKSSLLRELESVAAERGAVTATTDETVSGVPGTMAAISAQFARQGIELKALDKALAAYRQRRHEAETASAVPDPGPGTAAPAASATSTAVARAGLIGLGMVPAVGAFAGAIDAAQVAQSTDRARAALGARFRNHDDVRLVLEPLEVLTPVFLRELNEVAGRHAWIALFFDTYEQSSPFLDPWLLDLVTTDRYGRLPANLVVTLAGQYGPDPARWGDYAGFVTEFAVEPFTESEARQLLAAKGVVDEGAVNEVLRLSDRLPVLVSTLAGHPAGGPGPAGDPAATAVDRFLRWEEDPGHRATALACSFPRHLDEDVFGVVAGGEATGSYGWLSGLPFVSARDGRVRYHDVVRSAMLRQQRTRSPRRWADRHTALAETYGAWRTEAGEGLPADELWADPTWRELRLEETYHSLCARPRTALGPALADAVHACRVDEPAARGCAQVLYEAGEHADADQVRGWGRELLDALAAEPGAVLPALGLLLDRAALDDRTRAEAHSVRGREYRRADELDRALAECDRAVALDPADEFVHANRGYSRQALGDHDGALSDFDRALETDPEYLWALVHRAEAHRALGSLDASFADLDTAVALAPDNAWLASERGDAYRLVGRYEDAVAELGRACELDPDYASVHAGLGFSLARLGRAAEARTAYDRAIELSPDYTWALVQRAHLRAELGDEEGRFADLDRAVAADGSSWWARTMRGVAHSDAGRHEAALADFDAALETDPDRADVLFVKTRALWELRRHEESLPLLDRVVRNDPGNAEALYFRGTLHRLRGRRAEAVRDFDRALAVRPDDAFLYEVRAAALISAGRLSEALADCEECLARDHETAWARARTVDILLWQERYDEALGVLDTLRPAAPDEDDFGVMVQCWYADLMTGCRERALATAEWLRAHDDHGIVMLALTVGAHDGLAVAETLWQEARHRMETEQDDTPHVGHLLTACALGQWQHADTVLAGLLAEDDWEELADVVTYLALLARTRGVDRACLGPRLTRATESRNALRDRHAAPV
ncbi:tetratricopeptide repeat protein [Streptomyces sp. FB2]|uniref:ATP-binding protein n=1 Tax=Streptomyces sp. FB2 TaxID=2902454 RepID=UPI001F484C77|nr:ATP-binding protein [Streptomyces sp. FB2]MCF2535335.1 tetratricopeptide repeat protein [Streptomyces sp. FB2]